MKFRDVANGAFFRFVWSGYTCVKVSARRYLIVNADGTTHGQHNNHVYQVGSIDVAVEPWTPEPVQLEP